MSTNQVVLLVVVVSLVVLIDVVFLLKVMGPAIKARMNGMEIPFPRIMGLQLKGHKPGLLVDACIQLARAGRATTLDEAEEVFLKERTRIQGADDLVRLIRMRKP